MPTIQLGPASIFMAPVGEPMPGLDDDDVATVGNWSLYASPDVITEDGIIVETNGATSLVRSLGSIMAVVAGRTSKDFALAFSTMDMRAEAIALADGIDPADTDVGVETGTAGERSYSISTNPVPTRFAVVVRWDQGAYDEDGGRSQYEIKCAVQIGTAGNKWHKGDPNTSGHLLTALKIGADPVVYRTSDGQVFT